MQNLIPAALPTPPPTPAPSGRGQVTTRHGCAVARKARRRLPAKNTDRLQNRPARPAPYRGTLPQRGKVGAGRAGLSLICLAWGGSARSVPACALAGFWLSSLYDR